MKNEIIHGKIIDYTNIVEYLEEYRSKDELFSCGFKDQYFANCVFKDIGCGIDFIVGCTFKHCVFKDVVFDSLWFTDDWKNSFEDCMFFNCETGDFDLADKINLPESTNMKCPRYDRIIGYKILRSIKKDKYLMSKYLLATLEIPAGVKRSSAIGNKCRCEYAKVLSIIDENGNKYDIGRSMRSGIMGIDNQPIYKVGEYVYADSFDENRFNECAPGIHFFMTPEEAWDYVK